VRRTSDARLAFGAIAGLAACAPSEPNALTGGEETRSTCGLGDETECTEQCDAERVQNGERRELVMRHPDGGFRRFEIVSDGRGLVAADGSEEAVVTPLTDGRIQLSVGGDRYRLPATVKRGAGGG